LGYALCTVSTLDILVTQVNHDLILNYSTLGLSSAELGSCLFQQTLIYSTIQLLASK
jgi:hypothetical protein